MNIAIPRRFGDVRGMEDVKIEKVKKLSVSNQRRLHYESLYSIVQTVQSVLYTVLTIGPCSRSAREPLTKTK
jgi:hypothetical protein